jgi:hypothetical protein
MCLPVVSNSKSCHQFVKNLADFWIRRGGTKAKVSKKFLNVQGKQREGKP